MGSESGSRATLRNYLNQGMRALNAKVLRRQGHQSVLLAVASAAHVSDKITRTSTAAKMISSTIAMARITFPIIVVPLPEPCSCPEAKLAEPQPLGKGLRF